MPRVIDWGALALLWAFSCTVDSEPAEPSPNAGGAGATQDGEAGADTAAGQGGVVPIAGAPNSSGAPSGAAGATTDAGGIGGLGGVSSVSDAGGLGGVSGGVSDAGGLGGAVVAAGGAAGAGELGGAGAAAAGAGGDVGVSCPPSVAPPVIEVGDALAPVCSPGSYTSTFDIAYGPGDMNLLDLRVPHGLSTPAPLVIWIHGNGWRGGSRAEAAQALRLLCRGYAVASIEYRLSSDATFPAQIVDVKAAVRYLRAQADTLNLDPDRFVAFGSSAGGYLAALLGVGGLSEWDDPALGNDGVSSAVQAVVDWYGPMVFDQIDADLEEQGCSPITQVHGLPDSAESELLGCTVAEPACADDVARANPLTYVTAALPPFLIMHGSEDCLSAIGQSQRLHDALLAAGTCSSFHIVQGAVHNGTDWETPEPQDAVADFLDSIL
ncbi:MAG TPA: alpha/beta hydrolase [Polyangiaceae bacterium]|nr:alpha/beta hydrolase [Polyangiaceae bacterium]